MSQLILSVFDQTSSQELFYVNGFTFHPGTSTQYSWSIDPRQIGAAQLKQSQLTSAKSLSVVGIVKISNDGSNWYQLTASSPVPVQVNVTNQQTSQQQTTSQNNSATTLYNPVSGVNSLTDLLLQIMKGFLAIVAVWAVAFIVIGGFRMVITQGNEEAIGAAKKTITWAILGLVVALLSFSIIAIVQNLIGVDIQPVSTSLIKTINKPL
ncbi:MAG TPA: pilin [Patescibacteria group bacterium]|nr:pilin [Patescibacteria group bacterium]